MIERREFLKMSAGVCSVGASCPGIWARAADLTGPDDAAPVLVVVELTGGNDGLNTVVPVHDDIYRRSRPTLAVAENEGIRLDEQLCFHPSMRPLMEHWEHQELAIVQNAGYPHPNRSHFRAMEIWQSGRTDGTPTEGWLGRVSDSQSSMEPMFVGSSSVPLAVQRRHGATAAIESLADYRLKQSAVIARPDYTRPGEGANPLLTQIASQNAMAAHTSAQLSEVERNTSTESEFEARLMTIRGMLQAGFGTRVFYTALAGFDTHQTQRFLHAALLRNVAQSLNTFVSALRRDGLYKRVLILVYSEFGRRVKENGSGGTDHGAAAPLMLLGAAVRGGLHGGPPDLSDLADGDVRFKIDFRDVYATVLHAWFQIDPTAILGSRIENLPLLDARGAH